MCVNETEFQLYSSIVIGFKRLRLLLRFGLMSVFCLPLILPIFVCTNFLCFYNSVAYFQVHFKLNCIIEAHTLNNL